MKRMLKRIATGATLMATLASTSNADAQEYACDVTGCGYQETCCAPTLTPYILLGTVAIVAIIVLAVSNNHHKNSHCHSH